ncbi:MAG: RdgB/HAM1 family non-canonical purine NTP pyrophosphatase [Gammaproteobacteria bacterium]
MKKNNTIYLASDNPGKIKEFNEMLSEHKVLSYRNIIDSKLPDESGLSFIENAMIKARFVSAYTQSNVLADDSGLIVPELNHAPGIKSARFAGDNASDQENRIKLQDLITKSEAVFLPAYFVCVLVLIRFPNDPLPLIKTGKIHGFVSKQEKGDKGFGYDKMFYLKNKTETLASIEIAKKNLISHRAQAVKKLLATFSK